MSQERNNIGLGNESNISSFEQKNTKYEHVLVHEENVGKIPMDVKPYNTPGPISTLEDGNSSYSLDYCKETMDFETKDLNSEDMQRRRFHKFSVSTCISEPDPIMFKIGLENVDSESTAHQSTVLTEEPLNRDTSQAMDEIKKQGSGDWPELHGAIQGDKWEWIQNPIEENGADVNAEDASGNKPMGYTEDEEIKKALGPQTTIK